MKGGNSLDAKNIYDVYSWMIIVTFPFIKFQTLIEFFMSMIKSEIKIYSFNFPT